MILFLRTFGPFLLQTTSWSEWNPKKKVFLSLSWLIVKYSIHLHFTFFGIAMKWILLKFSGISPLSYISVTFSSINSCMAESIFIATIFRPTALFLLILPVLILWQLVKLHILQYFYYILELFHFYYHGMIDKWYSFMCFTFLLCNLRFKFYASSRGDYILVCYLFYII